MTILLLAAATGYGAGTLLAIFLSRLYTGAPLRGSLGICGEGKVPNAAWAGTVGYLLARGRCPSGGRWPLRFVYLPLIGSAAGVVIVARAVDARHMALATAFSVVLLALVATDFERHLLPNRLMYPALAAAVTLCWAWPERSAVNSLAGGALGFAIMFVLFLVLPGFGFGDVKLAALLGLVSGLDNTLPSLLIGVVAAGAGAALMLITRRAGLKSLIAYGPYLALGAFIGMLST